MMQARFLRWILAAIAAMPLAALAQAGDPARWQLNMGRGVTSTSQNAYDAHMLVLWICLGIGLVVFLAMGYAIFAFRKSKGAVAAKWSHHTGLEVLWTVIPVILLVVMAWPATTKLIAMYDTRDSAMTIKVTGYQWMWKYDYLGEDVSITSRLDRESDRIRQSGQRPDMAANPYYLLDVDNELVVPVDTKIRFVITADDVIHSWWVPALGWKQDAVPGIINEGWAEIREPGVYRGQCAELCGKDHGFMPIVVRAVPQDEYATWLASMKTVDTGVPTAPSLVPEGGDGNAPRSLDPDMIDDVQQGEEPAAPQAPEAAPADATSAA